MVSHAPTNVNRDVALVTPYTTRHDAPYVEPTVATITHDRIAVLQLLPTIQREEPGGIG